MNTYDYTFLLKQGFVFVSFSKLICAYRWISEKMVWDPVQWELIKIMTYSSNCTIGVVGNIKIIYTKTEVKLQSVT